LTLRVIGPQRKKFGAAVGSGVVASHEPGSEVGLKSGGFAADRRCSDDAPSARRLRLCQLRFNTYALPESMASPVKSSKR